MSIAAKDYFVIVNDGYLGVGKITASNPNGPEDTDMAVIYHQKCHDETLKILSPIDNEPAPVDPRYTIRLHVDIGNLKISVHIESNKVNEKIDYEIEIEEILH